MYSYCLKCKKNAESNDLKVSKTKSKKNNAFVKVCNRKKSRLINEQDANRLLSQLATRNPLNKIPLLGHIKC